jgi:hypothetical protein
VLFILAYPVNDFIMSNNRFKGISHPAEPLQCLTPKRPLESRTDEPALVVAAPRVGPRLAWEPDLLGSHAESSRYPRKCT